MRLEKFLFKQKENSTAIRQGEKGIIDSVFVTQDQEGNKIVQVRTRDLESLN